MVIMIWGGSGYVGFPLCVELAETTKHKIISIDNDSRNDWVEKCGGERQYQTFRRDNL